MVWVIIGCTVLIIVCLGGGMRLTKLILWLLVTMAAIAAAAYWSVIGTILIADAVGAVLGMNAIRAKLVAWEIARRETDQTPP